MFQALIVEQLLLLLFIILIILDIIGNYPFNDNSR
jgi:hypothetical protein